MERHPDNEPLIGALAFRPEASLLYLNAEYVLTRVLDGWPAEASQKRYCDLSASP